MATSGHPSTCDEIALLSRDEEWSSTVQDTRGALSSYRYPIFIDMVL